MLLKLVVGSVLLALVLGKCGEHTTCGSCAGAKDGLLTCLYCADDGGCHSSLASDCSKAGKITVPFDCEIPPSKGNEYNETFARNVVTVLISATNGDTPEQMQTCINNNLPGITIVKSFEVVCDSSQDTCLAYLAVSPADKAIILAYRGSKGSQQLIIETQDFLFNKVKAFDVGGNVDVYFVEAFWDLWNVGLQTELQSLVVQYPGYELWAVGHSLGGSLASMASAYLVQKKYFQKNKVKLVTFGQPRTGDLPYAQAHDNFVDYHYRIVHKHDLIPHMPQRAYDNLFDSPFHHRYEVWYNNNMAVGSSYQLCLRADDDACSNSVSNTNTDDHNLYFGKHLPDWYQSGCK